MKKNGYSVSLLAFVIALTLSPDLLAADNSDIPLNYNYTKRPPLTLAPSAVFGGSCHRITDPIKLNFYFNFNSGMVPQIYIEGKFSGNTTLEDFKPVPLELDESWSQDCQKGNAGHCLWGKYSTKLPDGLYLPDRKNMKVINFPGGEDSIHREDTKSDHPVAVDAQVPDVEGGGYLWRRYNWGYIVGAGYNNYPTGYVQPFTIVLPRRDIEQLRFVVRNDSADNSVHYGVQKPTLGGHWLAFAWDRIPGTNVMQAVDPRTLTYWANAGSSFGPGYMPRTRANWTGALGPNAETPLSYYSLQAWTEPRYPDNTQMVAETGAPLFAFYNQNYLYMGGADNSASNALSIYHGTLSPLLRGMSANSIPAAGDTMNEKFTTPYEWIPGQSAVALQDIISRTSGPLPDGVNLNMGSFNLLNTESLDFYYEWGRSNKYRVAVVGQPIVFFPKIIIDGDKRTTISARDVRNACW